jgi:hypothetical protein
MDIKIYHPGITFRDKDQSLILDPKYAAIMRAVETDEEYERRINTLAESIAVHGVEKPILCLKQGKFLFCLDGFGRVLGLDRVLTAPGITDERVKELLATLRIDLYSGADDESSIVQDGIPTRIYAAILRANTSGRQITPGQKRDLILAYLRAEANEGIFRVGKWVAEDVGCHRSWLDEVRNAAIEAGTLPAPPRGVYRDRKGRHFPAHIVQPKTDKPPRVGAKPLAAWNNETIEVDAYGEPTDAQKARDAEAEARRLAKIESDRVVNERAAQRANQEADRIIAGSIRPDAEAAQTDADEEADEDDDADEDAEAAATTPPVEEVPAAATSPPDDDVIAEAATHEFLAYFKSVESAVPKARRRDERLKELKELRKQLNALITRVEKMPPVEG